MAGWQWPRLATPIPPREVEEAATGYHRHIAAGPGFNHFGCKSADAFGDMLSAELGELCGCHFRGGKRLGGASERGRCRWRGIEGVIKKLVGARVELQIEMC